MNTVAKKIIGCLLCIGITLAIATHIYYSSHTPVTLTILAWPHMLDHSALQGFEKEHNCTIRIIYCENNDELIAKLEKNKHDDYDLMIISDFMVPYLIKNNFIQPLPAATHPIFATIYNTLQHQSYDPNNQYTLAFYWGLYGVGVQKAYTKTPTSWSRIFPTTPVDYTLVMVDDIRVSVALLSYYLQSQQTPYTSETIITRLQEQKKCVRVYTDLRGEYFLATGIAPYVVLLSADAARVIQDKSPFSFVIPDEGTIAVIDSFVYSSTSTKDDLAAAFLNFIYTKNILSHYVERFHFFSPCLTISHAGHPLEQYAVPTPELMAHTRLMDAQSDNNNLATIWLKVRS